MHLPPQRLGEQGDSGNGFLTWVQNRQAGFCALLVLLPEAVLPNRRHVPPGVPTARLTSLTRSTNSQSLEASQPDNAIVASAPVPRHGCQRNHKTTHIPSSTTTRASSPEMRRVCFPCRFWHPLGFCLALSRHPIQFEDQAASLQAPRRSAPARPGVQIAGLDAADGAAKSKGGRP